MGYFKLNPNASVNIQSLASAAIQADTATLQMIADFQKKNNLPVTVQPPGPVPVQPAPAQS